jgi:23S rRNA (guanosine2251-2'-O)-methyltransferase
MNERDIVIGGVHAVTSALERAPGDVLEIWIRRESGATALSACAEKAANLGLVIQHADDKTLDRLYGDSHHQGVVLRRRPPLAPDFKTWCASLPTLSNALILVLDTVQDPRNFGACVRVADGAGVTAVIYPRDKSAKLTSVVAKAASGAIDTIPLMAVTNLASALDELRRCGVWVTGAVHDSPTSLYDLDLRGPLALVLGNEGSGLRRLTRERCDHLAHIPMYGALASLNVATATAVCLFEACRQRRVPIAQRPA